MNNFLANGGDGFPGFKAAPNRVYAPGFDVDALTAYLGAHSPVAPGPQDRITKLPDAIERTKRKRPRKTGPFRCSRTAPSRASHRGASRDRRGARRRRRV